MQNKKNHNQVSNITRNNLLKTTQKKFRYLSFICILTALSLGATNQARADLKLCNTTASRVGIAIGYRNDSGWTTEGWWNVASQTCETLLKGNLVARYYYLHAVDYDRGGAWAGKAFMCTKDKAFTIKGIDGCDDRGFSKTGFFEVDTNESDEWTVRLTDPGGEAKTQ